MYIKRKLEEEIKKYLKTKEIIAVIGPRQCGKTTMLLTILKNYDKVSIASFDNIKQLKLFEDDIDSFIGLYVEWYNYLFIDEVQYAKDSGKKLKYIYDTQKIKIFISGSSAAELSIKSLKYLVGRIFVFKLFPFSFNEFLMAKDNRLWGIYNQGKYGLQILSQINAYLHEYMIYGGFPRVVLASSIKEKKKVLENIYNTYLLREIKEIMQLGDNDKLITLLKSLSLQIGNLINYNELSQLTGLSFKELKKYLIILDQTYVCSRVSSFHTNKRTELVKVPKIYFFDSGFRNTCIDNFNAERTDKGAMYENVIFTELIIEGITPKYWRSKSGAEVDFIISDATPIEIKSTINETKPSRSFSSFVEKYRPKKGFLVSLNFEGKKTIAGCALHFVPFVKFIWQIK